MKKYIKKISLLPIILGATALCNLLPTILLSNTNLISNENILSININKTEVEFTRSMANDLIAKKQLDPNWDGSLSGIDFGLATSIGASAFIGNEFIKKITLSTNIEIIHFEAFFECINLTEIILPNVKIIHADAFNHSTKLANISALKAISIGELAFFLTPAIIQLTSSENITSNKAEFWGTTADKLIINPSIVDPNPPPIVPDIPDPNPSPSNEIDWVLWGSLIGSFGGLLLIGLIVGGILFYLKKSK